MIGHWNIPELYMSFLYYIVEILSLFLMFDVSKEYDLKVNKGNQTDTNETETLIPSIHDVSASYNTAASMSSNIQISSNISVCKTLM